MTTNQQKLHHLLEFWNNIFQGKINDQRISFDNHLGKGFLQGYLFSEEMYALEFDFQLIEEIKGDGTTLVDDKGYINFLFGLTKPNSNQFITLNFSEFVELKGVILSNDDKQKMKWFHPAHIPVKALLVKIHPDAFYKLVSLSPPLKEKLEQEQTFHLFDHLDNLMLGTLIRAFEVNDPFYRNELIHNCVQYLITLSLARFSKQAEKKQDSSLNMQSLFKARQIIIEQKGSNININDLAKECGMSVSRLRLLFKTFFKQPIYKFQQEVRLEEAKRLLNDHSKTMSMIAMDLGFSNSSHFTSVFKKYFGITPKEYKKTKTPQ
ncbi:helix-turn-helix transcriptional regulator [Flammeovirga agarivorans]|uniref:Helix-turn-helix transcriptional regulator n=1 Tax=Flammeovirga agarivorans TaxID=2726742 RepID=A0A7X8XU53_9BACT|nr:response regulator transcription factor [Flammeovirga agarivorans]NLR90016.1 helix-turn-helix transcriptional regulator [Flammeovirga agarivorans]